MMPFVTQIRLYLCHMTHLFSRSHALRGNVYRHALYALT